MAVQNTNRSKAALKKGIGIQMTLLNNLKDDIGTYIKTSLAEFYSISSHRLMVYAVTFILVGLGVFAALAVYDASDKLINIHLKFMGIHAWHTALVSLLGLLIVDMGAAYLIRPWGAYERRTVGKMWLIFFASYLLNYLLERLFAYKLIGLYEPMVLYLWEFPNQRPGIISEFLFILPFWMIITSLIMKIITSKQAQTEDLLREKIETILEEQARQKLSAPGNGDTETQPPPDEPHLQLPTDTGVDPIYAKNIGHVTAEDHYLRIFFHSGDELKNTLIRMPLKELLTRLPAERFIQIHRSHLVNIDHISGLKRSGRSARLSMKHGEFDLPVSRYRLPQLLPMLEGYLNP